jgi:hypothetical protein
MKSFRGILLPAVLCLIASSAAQAAFTIDNFTDATPTITQTGVGSTTSAPVSGAGILGNRTIGITVDTPLTSASASAGLSPGLATASFNGEYNPVNMNNKFDVNEVFSAVNAITDGDTTVSFLLGSFFGATVKIIANGTSTFTFTDPVNLGGSSHSINFSAFSNPAVFSSLNSLEFIETFPNTSPSGPSVSFSGPILLNNPNVVPEPAAIAMIAQAGLVCGLFGAGRRFFRRRRAIA